MKVSIECTWHYTRLLGYPVLLTPSQGTDNPVKVHVPPVGQHSVTTDLKILGNLIFPRLLFKKNEAKSQRLTHGSGKAERSRTSDPEQRKESWVGMTKGEKWPSLKNRVSEISWSFPLLFNRIIRIRNLSLGKYTPEKYHFLLSTLFQKLKGFSLTQSLVISVGFSFFLSFSPCVPLSTPHHNITATFSWPFFSTNLTYQWLLRTNSAVW